MHHNWVKFDDHGIVTHTGLPLKKALPVGPAIMWTFMARSRNKLVAGLQSKTVAGCEFKLVESARMMWNSLGAYLGRWDKEDRQMRFTMPGMALLPGFGLAKKIADHFDHRWVIRVTVNTMAAAGYQRIFKGKDHNKLTCDFLGSCLSHFKGLTASDQAAFLKS